MRALRKDFMTRRYVWLCALAALTMSPAEGLANPSAQQAARPSPPAQPAQASPAAPQQASPTERQPNAKARPKKEAEFLVPPGGGAFEVPIHLDTVVILTMPGPILKSALSSDSDTFEARFWSDDGVAVRAVDERASSSTLALATVDGSVKVNVTFQVVPSTEEAQTLVRVKAATQEEVIDARVAVELEKRLAPKLAAIAAREAKLEEAVRARAESVVAERILRRNGTVALGAHARNRAAAIAHVRRAFIVGEDAYLMFQIENRSRASYRLASVRVQGPDGRDRAGLVVLSGAPSKDASLFGAVPAGMTASGVVAVRGYEAVKGKPLTMTLSEPKNTGAITLTSGIEIE